MVQFQGYSDLNNVMIMSIFDIEYDYLILRLTHLPSNSLT